MKKNHLYILVTFFITIACRTKNDGEADAPEPQTITPVTVTPVSMDTLNEYIDLEATSTFLLKSMIKANINGYIQSAKLQPQQLVTAGQTVFTIQTKESQSIGNTINLLDTSFKFSGTVNVKAGTTGYVTEINHQAGDYVQEGEQLAVISDLNSFVFILNLPYELRPYVLNKKTANLLLPDGKILTGTIASVLPVVDSVSQTQQVVIRVNEKKLPVNLVARVRVIKSGNPHAISLPRKCVLTDETQTNFWVMKVLDSTTAVKVPVTKGIETGDRVEILSPVFSDKDKFLLTGNYGLPDTAKIKIIRD